MSYILLGLPQFITAATFLGSILILLRDIISVRDIIAVPRVALRATPRHPSDVRQSRAGGTCP